MSRNAESRFAVNPTNIDMSRSRFDRNSKYTTTFNVGKLIPFYVDEVLPGDTFKIKTSKVVRLQTLIRPVMDNLFLDTYFFFVPNRLVWEHWINFMGENTQSAWLPTVEYQVPQLTFPATTGFVKGSVADYMGVPTGVTGNSDNPTTINALPFRAYAKICEDWFRDENLSPHLVIPTTDSTAAGLSGDADVEQDYSSAAYGGVPYTVAKYHDYFTSALPSPQKGPDVTVNVGNTVPVYGDGSSLTLQSWYTAGSNIVPLSLINGSPYEGTDGNTNRPLVAVNTGSAVGDVSGPINGSSVSGVPYSELFTKNADKGFYVGVATKETMDKIDPRAGGTIGSGLYADMSAVSGITINALRTAFQIQKLYEKDARGGTRYIEILKSHFGVTSPDARLQRSEYLGGNRLPINVQQVVQNSESATTPQGNLAAYSLTSDTHFDFTRSFVEHGYVIGVCVARYRHTYQQGLPKTFSRKDRFDYYWPVLANIGEQPIMKREIYCDNSATDDQVFGYQEAWADYRYKPSIVTGEMRSNVTGTLDSWHFADNYSAAPTLSSSWIREDLAPVDRALAVTSEVSDQILLDMYIEANCTRPMPMYSIPGLIDHH